MFSAKKSSINIHNYIHIAVYSSIISKKKVTISNYANISSQVSIYSSNNNYSSNYMSNPVVPSKYTNIHSSTVFISKHVIISCKSIVLPNVILHKSAAIKALSVVKKNCKAFTVNVSIPAKPISKKSKKLLKLKSVFKPSAIKNNL